MTGLAKLSTHRRWLLGAAAVLGLSVTIVAWHTVETAEEERILGVFRRRAETQMHLSRARLMNYAEMVHSLQSLFTYSDRVTRAEFDGACASLFTRHPGVQALQWIEVVTPENLAAFTAVARLEYPEFTPFERTTAGMLQPLTPRSEYTLIRLISPLAGNERALGYDASTAPTGGVLERARRDRQLSASQSFRLIQATSPEDEHGIVFALPVFARAPPDGDGAFRGFVQAVFRVETMLAQSHRSRPDEALLIHYTDLDAAPGFATLYVNHAGREIRPALYRPDPAEESLPVERDRLTFGGRRWELTARLNPAWRNAQRTLTPPLVFAGGLVTTGIVMLALSLLFRRAGEIEDQVALRTAELQQTKRELELDILRRRETEHALQTSEQRLDAIINNSPSAIVVKDRAGRYQLCNRNFEQACGRTRSDIIGRTDAELFPGRLAAIYRENDLRVLTTGVPHTFEEPGDEQDPPRILLVQKFPLQDDAGAIYAICGIATDITERIDFERRLRQTQKLESLGVLAGGIAHDFNNILTAVLANASLARHLLPAGSPVAAQLEQIEIASRRAADLCTQMLAYAGKRRVAPGRLDLSSLVRDTAALLEVSVPKTARLHLALAADLPPVEADSTQLGQIVMNLVINAAEALGGKPGDIHVTTHTEEAAAGLFRRAVQHPDLPGGRYVVLTVRDTGCGIPAEALAQIFEPFYTTKFAGRGLGLSVVLGIVRSHHGALFVESVPDRGATFRLFLPAVDAGSATPAPAAVAADGGGETPGVLPRLQGTVLLVDDEIHVREIIALALQSCGLKVIEASDGQEALRICEQRAGQIGLILLDLTMPGLSGEEVFRELRARGGRWKVILMSGYSESQSARRCLEQGAAAFVHKPFELEPLLQLIAAHLR